MLRAGGSAVDACVAAAFASWIAEPALTGPGGGGFLVAYDGLRGRPLAIDCFVAVPGEAYDRRARCPARALRGRLRHRAAGLPRRPWLVRRARRDGGARGGSPQARAAALERAGATCDRARPCRRRADARARRRDRRCSRASSVPRRRAHASSARPTRLCAPATARATRRSERRWSASRPTAHASWPTARPPTRCSPTRPRREAA